jgi:hypothetical protein
MVYKNPKKPSAPVTVDPFRSSGVTANSSHIRDEVELLAPQIHPQATLLKPSAKKKSQTGTYCNIGFIHIHLTFYFLARQQRRNDTQSSSNAKQS